MAPLSGICEARLYFDNGWTRTATDPWDIVTAYDYNPLGQQTARTITSAGGSSARTIAWDYFPDGKLKSRTDDGVPVGSQVVLVDNTDAQNVSAVGTWPASTAAPGFQGFDYQTHGPGTGSNTFTWNLTIPQDGTYQVFVRYPVATATNAPYTITATGGATTTRTVNQTTNAGTWVSLGSFPFTTTGTGQKITLTDNANGTITADAVKLVRDNAADTDNEKTVFTFGYDPNGNQTLVTDSTPGTAIDTYTVTYNGLDQVSTVEEKLAGTAKHTTTFTYDPNGNTTSRTHDSALDTYTYDPRDLVSRVTNATSATDPAPKVTTFTYTPRRQPLRVTKANGNTIDLTYLLDGAPQRQTEKKSGGALVADHTLDYDLNGNRTTDTSAVQNADDHTALINRTATNTYDPRDRIATVTNAGSTGSTESYIHDANNNVISQTVKGATTTFTYNRNRLTTATTAGVTASYNYDPFGRLDTVTAAGQTVVHYTYDGFDRISRLSKLDGTTTRATTYTYDPLDRTASRTDNAGTPTAKTTAYNYLALTELVLDERVAGRVTRTYQYSPTGMRLSQVTVNGDDTTEDSYYGYNSHTDVEQITDPNGDTRATYGYTAYGTDDTTQFTGIDKNPTPGSEPFNPFRFNGKRVDPTSGTYDMGFRNYDPGLNRFLTRDLYNGALADMGLGLNPYTSNRYAYGAGNPITTIELDGHFPGVPGVPCIGCAIDAVVSKVTDPVTDKASDIGHGTWNALGGFIDGATDATVSPVRSYLANFLGGLAPLGCPSGTLKGSCAQGASDTVKQTVETKTQIDIPLPGVDKNSKAYKAGHITGEITGLPLPGGAIAAADRIALRGIQDGVDVVAANFAQKTARFTFSEGGRFADQTIEDIADALRSGALTPKQIPIDVIVREGNTLILNTRSALALINASVPRTAWNVVNRTGVQEFEERLTGQLTRNGLDASGVSSVRITGVGR